MRWSWEQLTPLERSQNLAQRFGNCAVDIVPGAGHLSNMDNADAFNQMLDAFLRSVAGAKAAA